VAVKIIAYANYFVKETLKVTYNQQTGTLTSATHEGFMFILCVHWSCTPRP